MSDSFMGRPPNQLKAIKKAISDGTLDAEAIHQTMLAEISRELNKPAKEVDMHYVDACEKLLTLLNSNRASAVKSHYDRNLAAIHKRLRQHSNPSVLVRSLRLVIACCLVPMLIFGASLLFQDKVSIMQSSDGQQLILQGEKAKESAVSYADIANPSSSESQGTYDTTNWNDAVSLYGSIPNIPRRVPEGWKLLQYNIDLLATSRSIAAIYQSDLISGYLIFTEKVYMDMDAYRSEIEQNKSGEIVTLNNGTIVYITKNFGLTTALWQDGATQYTAYGPIATDDLLQCIESTGLQMEE